MPAMRLLRTVVAAFVVAFAPACLQAQAQAQPAAAALSPTDSVLLERLMAQHKAASEAKDYVEAVRLAVRIGTVSRNAALLHRMGHFLESGTPELPRDEAEAVRVFGLAADLGDAESQHHVGMRYLEGRGLPVDQARGIALLRLSAAQGYSRARDELRRFERMEQAARQAALEEAVKCADAMLLQGGWDKFSSSSDLVSGDQRYIRVWQKAPTLAEVRGDAVTVERVSSYNWSRGLVLRDTTGFVGITEKLLPGTQFKVRDFGRRVAPSREGSEAIARVRAACAPR